LLPRSVLGAWGDSVRSVEEYWRAAAETMTSTAAACARASARTPITGRREKEGRETLAMLRAGGGDGSFIQLDVSVESEVMAVVRETMSRHGRLDCAVNCD
jgi:NAD(P)-dependent dehydrogenase (short-subunit alcohol dehydrogenase family)